MKKKTLKREYRTLVKKCEVLGLLLKMQTFKIESLREEILKLEKYKNGILSNKH